MEKVTVNVKPCAYDVIIGSSLMASAGSYIVDATAAKKYMIVSNKKVFGLHGKKLLASFKGVSVSLFLMPDGEKFKTLDTVNKIYGACVKAGLDRHSCIVAFGGGVTGDVAGFAAATYMRGIPYVQVPTTLLSQVDSSVGGKTGVDLEYGKNLAGAFYQPKLVIADVGVLKTLSEREFNNGMAEVIKHGIIADKKYFDFITDNADELKARDDKALTYIVKGSVRIKAGIVEQDERETTGMRALLNFGHTAGHAVEAAAGFGRVKHGEAIAIGMVIAAKMSKKMGLCGEESVNSINQALKLFNLIKPLKNLKKAQIIKRLFTDKKVKDGKIRFVLTKGIGYANFVDNADLSLIKREISDFLLNV